MESVFEAHLMGGRKKCIASTSRKREKRDSQIIVVLLQPAVHWNLRQYRTTWSPFLDQQRALTSSARKMQT